MLAIVIFCHRPSLRVRKEMIIMSHMKDVTERERTAAAAPSLVI